MNKIPVFKAEAEAGLADQIKNNTSIAYYVPLKPVNNDQIIERIMACQLPNQTKIVAKIGDVYPITAILASTVWNLNDDIFDKVETWASRYTAVNKPSNIGHDEKKIVGHMTNSWAMNDNGETIPDDCTVSDLPDLYHVCVGSVIYTVWEDAALSEEVDKLIEEIKSGDKYVSMECIFANFDYGVKNPSDNKLHIISRNEETAYLTKHLRRYGGTGTFEGYSIGRVPRNFSFSGKGFVDKPANPDSIIFDKGDILDYAKSNENPFILTDGVYLLREKNIFSAKQEKKENHNMSEDLLKEAKAEVVSLREQCDELKEKLAKADIEGYKTEIEALKAAGTEDQELITKLTKDFDDAKAEIEELKKTVEELETAKSKLEAEMQTINEEKMFVNRVSALVDGNISKEVAEEKVKLFANLNDEQFDVVASELIKAAKASVTTEETEETEETTTEEAQASEEEVEAGETTTETLETAEAEEEEVITPPGETEENTSAELRKSVAALFADRLGIKTENDE